MKVFHKLAAFCPSCYYRTVAGLIILLHQAPLFAQYSADSSNQNLSDNYLEEIFAKVSDPQEATRAFHDALEHLSNPTPENEKRLTRLYADIIDIMSDAESIKWKELKTAEERISFLKRFWLVRDLTPATATNERLVEHYKRLLHARTVYSFFDFRGYDDRGLVYVKYGSPDDGEENVFESDIYPVSSWVYYRFGSPVNFDFIDNGSGYRLNSRLTDALVVKEPLGALAAMSALMRQRMNLSNTYVRHYLNLQQISPGRPGAVWARLNQIFNEFTVETASNQTQLAIAISEIFQDLADLPCEIKVVQFENSDHKSDLVIAFGFKKTDIKGRADTVHVQVATALRDTTLKILASQNTTYHLTFDTSQTSDEFVGVDIYSLPISKYDYALDVTNTLGVQRGLRDLSLTLAQYPQGRLHSSNVIFATKVDSATSAQAEGNAFKRHNFVIVPYPFTKLKRQPPIFVYLEIYDLQRDANSETFYEVEYTVNSPEKKGLASLLAGLNPFRKSGGSISVSHTQRGKSALQPAHLQLDFSQLRNGKYELIVRVTDNLANITKESKLEFELE